MTVVDIVYRLGTNEQDCLYLPLMHKRSGSTLNTRAVCRQAGCRGVLPGDGPDGAIRDYRDHLTAVSCLQPVSVGYTNLLLID